MYELSLALLVIGFVSLGIAWFRRDPSLMTIGAICLSWSAVFAILGAML